MSPSAPRRWLALFRRIVELGREPPESTPALVTRSYDRIACGYDEAWTAHMRDLSLQMLDALRPREGALSVDLTCGTGFVTGEVARRTGTRVLGVDGSPGMLEEGRRRHPDCDFLQSDILTWLRTQPAASRDVVTCAWGLGYSRPLAVLREIRRVLRPGGRVGLIDNSLFSLAGVIWTSVLAFAEHPDALSHVMRVRFLPGRAALWGAMRLAGLRVERSWGGEKSYRVPTGQAAIARLTETGAAAGFEFAAEPEQQDAVYRRFAEILESRYARPEGIRITHRYVAAVGERP